MKDDTQRILGQLLANSESQGREIGEIKSIMQLSAAANAAADATLRDSHAETRKIVDSHVTTIRVMKWSVGAAGTAAALFIAFMRT